MLSFFKHKIAEFIVSWRGSLCVYGISIICALKSVLI